MPTMRRLSEPRHLLMCIHRGGAAMAIGGLALCLAACLGMAQMASSILGELKIPCGSPKNASEAKTHVSKSIATGLENRDAGRGGK
jgi:hypothetical protein